MRNDPISPDSAPSPEQLAAFLDGALGPAECLRVEAWLANNPDAAGEIDGQRCVLRLWNDNAPPQPGPAAWVAAFARIEARLPARRPRRLARTLWLCAGAAAAVLAAVLLGRLLQPGRPNVEKTDPLPVIEPGDVVVISMDARDASGLVVASPPVRQPIVLAGQEDVSVMNVEPYWEDGGQAAEIGGGDVPMIVAPVIARPSGRTP